MHIDERKPAMNDEERQEFWETLCSLTGENPQEDVQKLAKKSITQDFCIDTAL